MTDMAGRLWEELDSTKDLIADLESDLEAIAESTALSPDDEHDPEGATVGFERARVASLLEQTRRALADIEAAIVRCEAGGYGFCERCGTTIAAERLEALPTTSLCITCAARTDW